MGILYILQEYAGQGGTRENIHGMGLSRGGNRGAIVDNFVDIFSKSLPVFTIVTLFFLKIMTFSSSIL